MKIHIIWGAGLRFPTEFPIKKWLIGVRCYWSSALLDTELNFLSLCGDFSDIEFTDSELLNLDGGLVINRLRYRYWCCANGKFCRNFCGRREFREGCCIDYHSENCVGSHVGDNRFHRLIWTVVERVFLLKVGNNYASVIDVGSCYYSQILIRKRYRKLVVLNLFSN